MSSRREFVGHLAAGAATVVLTTGTVASLEGCNFDWIQTAINDLPTIISVVTTVASIVATASGGGALTPAIAAIIDTASKAAVVALNLAKQLIADYQANPSATTLEKIKTALLDVQSQLGQILDASHVFNIALRTIVTTGLGVAITVLTQIMSLIPAHTAASTKAQATQVSKTALKPWNSKQVVVAFNQFAVANGYGQYVIAN